MASNGDVVTPGEAAKKLGIASSTLRIYSVKLSELLSEGAGRPRPGPDGRPGVRVYSQSDLRLLERAKELLGRGLTYEQVAADLRSPGPRRRDEVGPGGKDRPRAVGAAELAAVLDPLRVVLEHAVAGTEAWRRLAEEREREVAALRERLRAMEAPAAVEHRGGGWWSRLLGRG